MLTNQKLNETKACIYNLLAESDALRAIVLKIIFEIQLTNQVDFC